MSSYSDSIPCEPNVGCVPKVWRPVQMCSVEESYLSGQVKWPSGYIAANAQELSLNVLFCCSET